MNNKYGHAYVNWSDESVAVAMALLMTVDVWRLTFFKCDPKAIYQLPTNFPHSAHFDQSLFAKSSYSSALIRRVVQTCDYRKHKFFWKITPNPCTAQHNTRHLLCLKEGIWHEIKKFRHMATHWSWFACRNWANANLLEQFFDHSRWNCVSVMCTVSINMIRAIANHADLRHYLLWNVLLSTFHCRRKTNKKKMERKTNRIRFIVSISRQKKDRQTITFFFLFRYAQCVRHTHIYAHTPKDHLIHNAKAILPFLSILVNLL